ncbi:MATE family efflux transporter [Neglectibacter timonensis]|uniref:MATE family efflux transporter n=1 Tax=Neglectibacter timonensis TaxID=1776382 RepID=UPI003992F3FA
MKERIRPYLGDREFYKTVAVIAIPISLQSLITIGVNMMDTIMLGSMGEVALSASSLANQFINIFHICCMGIGMGASVLTSRFWGMQDKDSLHKTITIMYRLCFVFGLLFTAATIIAPDALMRIYTSDEEVIRAGVSYFRWSVPCYWLLGFSLTTTIVLRSVGQVKLPLLCSVIAFFINIFFNWVFIFGKLGAPRMEVAGAAVGTLISRTFEFLFICGYFLFFDKKVSYRVKMILMKCGDLLKDYLRISIPVLVSDGLLAFGNSAVAMVMGRIGKEFVSANAITMVVQQLSTVFIQGISNASSIITGHTLGAGDTERAQRQGVTFLGLGTVIGVLAGGLIMILSWPVINCYNVTGETKAIAEQLMLAVGVIVIFQSMNSILTKGVLRGGGDTKFLMLADILFLWIASIPLGYLAGLVWHLPAFWIYTFLKIDQFIKAVWCVFRLGSKKWIKKI